MNAMLFVILEIADSYMMKLHCPMDVACDLGYISSDELSHFEETIVDIVKPFIWFEEFFLGETLHKP